MVEKIQAIRGMNDVLPAESWQWRALENQFANLMMRYGYHEIRLPLIESTQLFKRSIGEVTDIVEKEMYSFVDLNGESISLRPEGTASCIRACLEHGLLHNQQQKLWYSGPMFRHEKPQKGRYRQFHQFGVEVAGVAGVSIELELIAMGKRLWKELGLEQHIKLEINTIGELNERKQYKEQLVDYLQKHFAQLDEDSQRRLTRNPLRILDSKNPQIQSILEGAPKMLTSLSAHSQAYFASLCEGLEQLGIDYSINKHLVRGLDYYSHTVFEWVTDKLGSQATVCAGGRYDALIEQLGGGDIPAVGFAIGVERLLLLLETLDKNLNIRTPPSFFVIATGELALQNGLVLAEKIRSNFLNCTVNVNTSGGGFKSQFKKADKSGADYALIIGDEEYKSNLLSIKSLRNKEEQITIAQDSLMEFIGEKLQTSLCV